MSWRALRFYLEEGHIQNWDSEALDRVHAAEKIWRGFLLGEYSNPGKYQQHLLPLDRICETTGELLNESTNINRYIMRAIHVDILRGFESIFTYVKLGRFIIIGFVHEPNPGQWKGTKVQATQGYIEPRQFVVPLAFGEYLNEKAQKMRDSLASMSDRQRENVDRAFRANVDRYIGSDAFAAMQADVELHSDNAFTRRPKI